MLPNYSAAALGSRIVILVLLEILILAPSRLAWAVSPAERERNNYYLPNEEQSKVVGVSTTAEAQAEIIVLTEEVASKEHGSRQVIKNFGEVYAFAPSFIAVRKDQPTRLTFWNLQGDDEHDFMLADPDLNVMMHVKLKPLSKNSWTFTFHKEGLFSFYCAQHQPEMNGQILVLPAAK